MGGICSPTISKTFYCLFELQKSLHYHINILRPIAYKQKLIFTIDSILCFQMIKLRFREMMIHALHIVASKILILHVLFQINMKLDCGKFCFNRKYIQHLNRGDSGFITSSEFHRKRDIINDFKIRLDGTGKIAHGKESRILLQETWIQVPEPTW